MNLLQEIQNALAQLRPKDQPCGIACNSRTYNRLKREADPTSQLGMGTIPMIVDNRLADDSNQVYYDATLWQARIQEQNQHDNGQTTDTTQPPH